ncbi:DNA primase [Blattabacterium cuenoti]|uniref:DNA primase n=1 Tax=Blattabacterium cuenoti TaxID=1653831 RepID=UPI00163C1D3A|nr:DNA primase [Blattabacterium cuenoti]
MISREIIEKIFSVSCIEEVIGDFVNLKKSGMNYRGLSPFSNEKTPSLVVSPIKKIWKDFSSGKGGNVITFLMEHEHFTYLESLHYLANRYNIQIPTKCSLNTIKKNNKYEKLYLIQKDATYFFIRQLYYSKEGKENGLRYLMQKRGLNMTTISKFGLGYAPTSVDKFTKIYLEKGYHINDLKQSGFTRYKNQNHFDCFRNRVMFPIYNLYGKVVGFGGRILNNIYNTKYINSSESEIFQKSKILYGLFQAKRSILKEGFCYLVEGYIDVLSLHQFGITNVVSSSGTSLTIDQILLIKKFAKTIILFYDGDRSGIKAALRVITMILEQEMNLRILLLPNGEDPDSMVKRYSYSQLLHFIYNNNYSFISYKKKIFEKFYQGDTVKKSFLVLNILNIISKISHSIQKEFYLQETSQLFDIKKEILDSELEKIINKQKIKKNKIKKDIDLITRITNDNRIANFYNIEKKLIQLILNYGDKIIKKGENNHITLLKVIQDSLLSYKDYLLIDFDSRKQLFYQIVLKKRSIDQLKKLDIIKKFNATNQHKSYFLSKWNQKGIEVPSKEEQFSQYFMDILLLYKSQCISKLIKKEITNFKNNIEKDNHYIIIKKIMHLTYLKNKIHKKLHRYVIG